MRLIALGLLTTGLCFADNTPPPATDKGFALELSWSHQEQSMDSNGQSESFTLKGDQLTWTWSYSGYHPDRHFVRNKKKTVKVKDTSSLRAIIDKGKLDQTREVKLGLNQHMTYTVTLRTTRRGKSSTLTASGYPPSEGAPEDWQRLEELHSALGGLVGAE